MSDTKRADSKSQRRGLELEWAAWLAGEPHTDRPKCVCPVLAAFGRTWNDSIEDDATRDRLLLQFALRLVGTRSSVKVRTRRVYMAVDWAMRVHAPTWLRLAGLTDAADLLAGLPDLTQRKARRTFESARKARYSAERAKLAALRAAMSGTGAVDGLAAVDATAGTAPYAAATLRARPSWLVLIAADARITALAAAQAVAIRAVAAGDDPNEVLAPTVAELQASAVELFGRMIDAG